MRKKCMNPSNLIFTFFHLISITVRCVQKSIQFHSRLLGKKIIFKIFNLREGYIIQEN